MKHVNKQNGLLLISGFARQSVRGEMISAVFERKTSERTKRPACFPPKSKKPAILRFRAEEISLPHRAFYATMRKTGCNYGGNVDAEKWPTGEVRQFSRCTLEV